MDSEATEIINFSSCGPNVRTLTRNKFGHLIEKLVEYFSPTNSTNKHDQNGICEIFDQLQQFIERDFSMSRKMDGLNVNNNAKILYLHMLYLKNKLRQSELLPQKVTDVIYALQQITKLSHDQYYGPIRALENRKLQISLGLVEVLTELFVLDIDIFGIQLNSYEKCCKFRRSIGNALMNLVYQQRDAKFRLCTNRQFLLRVADVIELIYPLIQFYAGLIQNVSYNVDHTIWHHLAIIVPPLVRSAVNISLTECDGRKIFDLVTLPSQRKQQLLKLLSALWNLAENPIENKRVMCNDVPEFVPMLLRIMRCDQSELQLIQAATGILKHLSDYLLQFPELSTKIIRKGTTSAFMRQLTSSSSDLVTDSLSALYTLSRHPIVVREILSNESYIQQIGYLTRNTNQSISRASRLVLNNVYSATAYFAFQHDRHLAKFPIDSNLLISPLYNTNDYSLSRTHFSSEKPNNAFKLENYVERKNDHIEDSKLENNDVVSPSLDSGGQDLPTSVMCTRNASSRSSFNSADMKFNNLTSTSQSVRSSVSQSPTSAADLPDSPSQCSSNKVFQLKEMELQILKALDENRNSGHCTTADISGNSDVHTASSVIKNSANDSCVLLKDHSSEGILAEAIRDYMPKPKEPNVGATRSSTPILTPISCNSPCKVLSENDEPKHKGCTLLLEECIRKAMPSKHSINSYQFEGGNTSSSRTSSSNAKIQHNNSEEDFHSGVEKDFIESGNNVVNAQLIVLDCLNVSTNNKSQSFKTEKDIRINKLFLPSCSNIPMSIESGKQRLNNRKYKNHRVISSVSDDGLQINDSQSSTYLDSANVQQSK